MKTKLFGFLLTALISCHDVYEVKATKWCEFLFGKKRNKHQNQDKIEKIEKNHNEDEEALYKRDYLLIEQEKMKKMKDYSDDRLERILKIKKTN